MTRPAISIALATFNGERHLEPQLRSLAAQSRLPAELVVVDDGSTDATKAMVGDFAKTAPFPVRLYENASRLGYRGNFMHAAGLCEGDLIAFCDQDDIWEPHKLAVMAPLFDDPAVLLAYHNATIVDEDLTPLGELYDAAAGRKSLPPLATHPWRLIKGFTQVFRRSLAQYSALQPSSVDPYWPDESLAHDQWFPFLASVLGSTIRLAEPLAQYRQHAANEHGWTAQSRLEPRPHFLLGAGFIAAAENRVELLKQLAEQAGPEYRPAIEVAVGYYDELARRLSERNSLYQSPSIAVRARTAQSLLRQGAYRAAFRGAHPGRRDATAREMDRARPGAPGFGWTGLLMDISAGVVLGPRAKGLL